MACAKLFGMKQAAARSAVNHPQLCSADPYFEAQRAKINFFLEDLLKARYNGADAKTAKLAKSIEYSLLSDGKRIRPLITLAICDLYKPVDDEAISLAATTELLHTASLMLDDLPSMDDAAYRRGRPTNHSVFGESTTMLAAMALWSEALRILSAIQSVEINAVVKEMADSVARLVLGQFRDLNAFRRAQTIEDLDECAYMKTAVLFKNAAKIGAIFSEASPAEQQIFESFGREFGLAYQIRDDILDATAPMEDTGKDAGADQRNGRANYATVLGIENARSLMLGKLRAAEAALNRLPYDTGHLQDLVKKFGK